jgi:hypothetical protein
MYQYDNWYIRRVSLLYSLPDFQRLWEEVTVENYTGPTDYETELNHPKVGVLTFRSLLITHSDFVDYPQVIAYIPKDKSDQDKFAAIGLPTQSHDWK